MEDYAIIGLAYNKSVRIYAANTTNLVAKAQKIHKTFPTASAAFGRFLTASALMSLMYDNDEKISLRIDCDGPINHMLVETHSGLVKGDISNPNVYLVYTDGPKQGKLDVGSALGSGFLHVTKDLGLKELFTSSTKLVTGEIGDDFTYYFATSEQTPSSVGLGVAVGKGGKVVAAGGYILQVLPGCSDEVITQLEEQIQKITSITGLLEAGYTPEKIIALLANNTEQILDQRVVSYHCGCSKVKMRKSLALLSADVLTQIKDEDHGAEIICNFCKKKYVFSEDDLIKIIKNKTT